MKYNIFTTFLIAFSLSTPVVSLAGNDLGVSRKVVFQGVSRGALLSEGQRNEIVKYLGNLRNTLVRAINKAEHKSTKDALVIYKRAIMDIMEQSQGRPELLMRITLAQGLDLTYGIPDLENDPSGRTLAQPPALANSTNDHLKAAILKGTMRLALVYYQNDVEAVSQGNLASLPFARLAYDRLGQSFRWWSAVGNSTSSIEFMRVSLYHVANIIKMDESLLVPLGQEFVGPEGLENLIARTEDMLAMSNRSERDGLLREFRRDIFQFAGNLGNKLRAIKTQSQTPVQ